MKLKLIIITIIIQKMKLKKYLMGILGVAALAACSSDMPVDNGVESPVIGTGDNFLSVAIEMPVSSGSRAITDSFDDGSEKESEITNIVFFFFDEAGNCIEVQKIDNPDFMKPAVPSQNPNITNYGTVEVRLKAGLKYKKVGVALNSPVQNATALKSQISSISDFLARTYDYVEKVGKDGSGQVMSNSIYYDMEKASENPTVDKKVDVIEITEKNIYTSAQKSNIDKLIENGEKKYVEIFVERVLARIDVTEATFDMSKYYVIKENGVEKKTITVYDHVNGTSEEILVRPVVKGMILNVLTPKTALVKPLQLGEVGYGVGDGLYKDFKWNDPDNKRSYWASTAFVDESDMKYFSWNDAVAQTAKQFSQYVHPNTQDYKPIISNEGSSLNTKIMVVAELHEFDKDTNEEKNAIDLVMFGADYMLSSKFLPYVANLVNRDIRNIDWDTADLKLDDDITLSDDQKKMIKTVVNNSFLNDKGYQAADFKLQIAESTHNNTYGDEDWAANVLFNNDEYIPDLNGELPDVEGLSSSLAYYIKNVIKDTRDATMTRINSNRIMYWCGGRTYFYTNIRHQGFMGLTGDSDSNFLYGVVRNHIYKVNLQGVYGLGTPVIDPSKPINPDRPNDDRPSYIKAKINILPWRVVTNNATIH